jgi:hypothetical protein
MFPTTAHGDPKAINVRPAALIGIFLPSIGAHPPIARGHHRAARSSVVRRFITNIVERFLDYLYSRGRGPCIASWRRLSQASRRRVDAKAQSFPERGHIKVRGGILQMLAIFIVRPAPKTDDQPCAGNLPADSLERMSQVRRAAAESEIGQADNLYVGIVEAHDIRGRHSGIVLHAASQPMFFKQLG